MTSTPEVVKLKREVHMLRGALFSIRRWLLQAFDDSQDMVDQSQQYLSFINGVLGHEDDVDEFLCGADDDSDYVSPVATANDTAGGRSDSGGVA